GHGALRLGARRLRLRAPHEPDPLHARAPRAHRPRRHGAGAGRGARGPRALGGRPPGGRPVIEDPRELVKPSVRALGHYTLPPRVARVKVDQNENPYELPADFKDEVLARMRAAPWGRYPEFVPRGLIEALARFAGWRPD